MNNYSQQIVKWQSDIEKWERYETDTLPTDLVGVLPKGKPIYQLLFERNNFPTLLEDCGTHIVIVPGGYKPSTPYYEQLNSTINNVNPPSVRLGGSSSLMSLVHVLVIPKKRIYNAMTITDDDTQLIKDMRQSGIKWALRLANGNKNQKYSLKWLLSGKLSEDVYDINKYDMSFDLDTNIKNINKHFKQDDIEVSFHMYPNNSVGWLHMHVWIPELATSGYDLHGHKNHNYNDIKKIKYYIKINVIYIILIIILLYYFYKSLFNYNS